MPSGRQGTASCPNCRKLEAQVKQLQGLLDEARKLIGQLNQRMDELEGQVHRQAARFRVPESKRKKTKAKPGRKPGHTPAYRKPPPNVDDFAEAPLDHCPQCGGPVHDVCPVKQIIEDIPEIQVHRLHLTTYRGRCPNCGPVRSTHPDQVSTATGAARTHIGRRALGLAADLNKHFGLSMRKTTALLGEHFSLRITPGGLSQALARIAKKAQPAFDELCEAVRTSEAIHADETSWWLGGETAWLWVFTNPEMTLYTIDNRNHEVVRRILGDDYLGVLISDCLNAYDRHPGRKSKCCAHHLKAISEAMELAPDSKFLVRIRSLLKAAITLHHVRKDVMPAEYQRFTAHMEEDLDELLSAPYRDVAELRIVNRLTKQREHLLTFLHVPGVDPTNNLAERQLRPAVIARKLSCGNKTQAGAHTFEVLASLAATCRQQGRSFAELVADCMVLGRSPPPLLAAE